MLIDLRLGIVWQRKGSTYKMLALLSDGNYYWELPLRLDVQFHAAMQKHEFDQRVPLAVSK